MKAALAEQSEKKPAAAEIGGWYALSASLLVVHENPHLPVTRRIPYGSCRVFVAVGRRLRVTQGRRVGFPCSAPVMARIDWPPGVP
jgi:hypothetical protein